jgi:hypothetical protein
MRTRIAIGATAVAMALGSVPAAPAHHSIAVFDGNRIVKIEGNVTAFRWVNPHASFQIEGSADGGASHGLWTVEMNAPNVLIGEGWDKSSLNVGDEVTVFANPLRDADEIVRRGLYVGVILASGRSLGNVAEGRQDR